MISPTVFDKDALQGRVAVVTGASGGLGVAIFRQLHSIGAQVVQVDISYPVGPTEIDGLLTVHCDIADPASVASVADSARSRFGHCDVLVNNAAISSSPVALEDFPIESWDRISRIPARRLGRPEDIGDAVSFLASDASTYINGQDIAVDGGFLKASLSYLYNNTDVNRIDGGASPT